MVITRIQSFFIPRVPVSVEKTAGRDVNTPKPLVLAPSLHENRNGLVHPYPLDTLDTCTSIGQIKNPTHFCNLTKNKSSLVYSKSSTPTPNSPPKTAHNNSIDIGEHDAGTPLNIGSSCPAELLGAEPYSGLTNELKYFKCYFNSHLYVILINARSVLNKLPMLRALTVIYKPPVIVITESWCHSDILDDEISLDNYTHFRCDREGGKGGGCLMYFLNELTVSQLESSTLNMPETLWVNVHLNNVTALIGCSYRAPGTFSNYETQLINTLEQLTDLQYDHKILCGDFNLPEINWDIPTGPTKFDKFLDTLDILGWKQTVTTPTRGNNVLDLIFCHNISPLSTLVGSEFPGSDHKTVMCALPIPLSSNASHTSTSQQVIYRNYSKANWALVESMLRSSKWDEYFTTDDLSRALTIFYHNSNICLDAVIPLQTLKVSPHRKSYIKPKDRKKLKKLSTSYFKHHDFGTLGLILKTLSSITQAQDFRMRKEERIAVASPARAYALTEILRKRMNRKNHSIPLLIDKGRLCTNSADICELFNKTFAGNYLKPSVQLLDIHPITKMAPTPLTPNQISTVQFTYADINQTIRTLKSSKGFGTDGISSYFYKYGGPDIPLLLLKIFTMSLETQTYPDIWKTTFIMPKHKSGSKTEVSNYRPINITPIASRIMERLVKNNLIKHMLSCNIISPNQHGFLKSRSCLTCHLDFFNFVTSSRDRRQLVLVIYFDISKAFDRVDHLLLTNKLNSLGIRDPLLGWLKSFLNNRSQIVKLGSATSKPSPITSGVVQGSVIGPLLFTLYINDICACFTHGKPFIFADDLKVAYTFQRDDLGNFENVVQKELDKMAAWSSLWNLQFNLNKCGWICFGAPSIDLKLTLQSANLTRLRNVVDLGLRYSSDLTFSEQVASQTRKSRMLLGCILRNFHDNEAKLILYKTCVRPLLEYCPFIISSTRTRDKLRMESIQRYFTSKLLGYDCKKDYISRCMILKLDPLWTRRLIINLIFFFKVLHKISFSGNRDIQFAQEGSYDLRNQTSTVTTHSFKSTLRENFFTVMYSKIWNSLPLDIRTCSSVTSFKRSLYRLLHSTDYINKLFTPRTNQALIYYST
uniref:Reverse transcriptase domain-containing protein n=1 Tax=Trichobilharzia regenti TaxID=157069 RepID=A0AA85ITI2_TRIRE|nr:unnamed protein product [Trichobilharzia regenti]